MPDIPSQLSFEHMLSHMFPGFFAALSIFMIIDIQSPFNLGQFVSRDINTLVIFYGILLLGGTILGVIIDGIHHHFIEGYFEFLENPYMFNWEKIPGDDDKRLKKFLNERYDIGLDQTSKFKKIGNTIEIPEGGTNSLTINKENTEVTLIINDNETHKFIAKNENNNKNIYYNSDITLRDIVTFCTNEFDCKKCHANGSCKFKNNYINTTTKVYFLFEADKLDKYIALREYLTKTIYYYSEFYSNTFIALIPFTIITPIYLVQKLHVDLLMAILGGVLLALLAIACLDSAWRAHKRWMSALYFAFCKCPRSEKSTHAWKWGEKV
jgi:hypothetical protein